MLHNIFNIEHLYKIDYDDETHTHSQTLKIKMRIEMPQLIKWRNDDDDDDGRPVVPKKKTNKWCAPNISQCRFVLESKIVSKMNVFFFLKKRGREWEKENKKEKTKNFKFKCNRG